VQFSRIQLSRRRSLLSGNGRNEPNKVDKSQLAVELRRWQFPPSAAAPAPESMRPDAPHDPAVKPVEELSFVDRPDRYPKLASSNTGSKIGSNRLRNACWHTRS
jgi:hypothetical protein